MTISSNKVITYNDLITSTVTYIKQRCQNISTPSVVAGYLNGTHPSDWNQKVVGTDPGTVKVTLTVADNIIATVTESEIKTQLEDFLAGRNLYMATDTEISHKSLINFVSNVSAFVCARVIQVVNPMSTEPNGYLMYLKNESILADITNINSLNITKTELQNNITSITNVNSLASNVHIINMNMAYNCSSSSSSCSSSSCSSSSSLFIAYMNLD